MTQDFRDNSDHISAHEKVTSLVENFALAALGIGMLAGAYFMVPKAKELAEDFLAHAQNKIRTVQTHRVP